MILGRSDGQAALIAWLLRESPLFDLRARVAMPDPVERYLTADHVHLAALLLRVLAVPDRIDSAARAKFRAGLLRHIGMEERILLPAAKERTGRNRCARRPSFGWTTGPSPRCSCPHRREGRAPRPPSSGGTGAPAACPRHG